MLTWYSKIKTTWRLPLCCNTWKIKGNTMKENVSWFIQIRNKPFNNKKINRLMRISMKYYANLIKNILFVNKLVYSIGSWNCRNTAVHIIIKHILVTSYIWLVQLVNKTFRPDLVKLSLTCVLRFRLLHKKNNLTFFFIYHCHITL